MSDTARFRPVLEARHRLLSCIRAFFSSRGFLEVETPIRVPVPAMEEHIDAEPSGSWFLRTSPELHMKRLLADGYRRIFQIGPCFRQGEYGERHHPEYTMLEWYRAESGAEAMLKDTQDLFCALVSAFGLEQGIPWNQRALRLQPPWPILSVRKAFLEAAGWDPVDHPDADRFDLDMVERVEPALPKDTPCVLAGYPADQAALAQLLPDGTADRWELYAGGLELANAYGELTDPNEQRRRFEHWATRRRAAGRPVYPVDEAFLAALERGLPPCAGIALGVDRLLMLLCGKDSLADVLPFRV